MAVLEWPEDVCPASLTGDQKVIPKPFVPLQWLIADSTLSRYPLGLFPDL